MLFWTVAAFAGFVILICWVAVMDAKPKRLRSPLPDLTKVVKRRMRALSIYQQAAVLEELRADVDRYFDHVFSEARANGIEVARATETALLRVASYTLTGRQTPDREHTQDLGIETLPFRTLQPEKARIAFREYIVSKYFPEKADYVPLCDALRLFAAEVTRNSGCKTNSEGFVRNTLRGNQCDWHRILANDMESRNS